MRKNNACGGTEGPKTRRGHAKKNNRECSALVHVVYVSISELSRQKGERNDGDRTQRNGHKV